MKKNVKNKLFYINSIILYIILLLIGLLFSVMFVEEYANDILVSKFASNMPLSSDILEVIIDDESNQKYTIPSDKSKIADLLDFFYTYTEEKVIGFDFTPNSFNDDITRSEKKLISQISKMDNMVSAFVPEIDESNSDEKLLIEFSKKHALNVDNKFSPLEAYYTGIVSQSSKLRNSTHHYGSVLAGEYVKDFANIVMIRDKFYPSLALKMYLLANNTNDITIDYDCISIPKTGLKLKYTSYDGSFYNIIRFYKSYIPFSAYTYPVIPAYKILDTYYALKSGITPKNHPEMFNNSKDGLINPEIFKNKTVFLGANISGPSADVLKTPISQRHPGVDIHATIYNNLISNHFLEWINIWYSVLIFVILCLAAFIVILRSRFLKGLLALLIIDLIFICTVIISAQKGILISYATPIFCQFVTAIFAYSYKFLAENRNKEMIKNAMGKYLSQDIMKNVVKDIEHLKLGGKRAVVTVLFSDIRGFTSLSEKMSAEEVSVILNEYFSQMEPIISKYNGVINKFIGDAVMAIFGEPIEDDNHPINAVKCAYEMLKKVEYLREKWLYEGKPKIDIGIGINTGEVFIGNIGTENRMEYTVIGDTVNLASRIEGYNKVYRTNLLVSSSTYSYISDIADVMKIKDVQIRGKSKKMDIFEVLRIEL